MMIDTYTFSRISASNDKKINEIQRFLSNSGLRIDYDVEHFIVAYHDNDIIGCGAIAGNVFKSIALSPMLRGTGFLLKLLTELINLAYDMGRFELFLFTKPENEVMFKQAGFFPIVGVKNKMVLMENSHNRLVKYCQKLSSQRQEGSKIGSLVINANPFTLGHQYLVEQVAKECDWLHLFVVEEDKSYFSYHDRYNMIKQGCGHVDNVTVHAGSDYLISRSTFPSYFIKDSGVVDLCHAAIDLQLFRSYIAPALGITHRFVGSEPFCTVTNNYNQQMAYWFSLEPFVAPPIVFTELKRIEHNQQPISASQVRALLKANDLDAAKALVPTTSYPYLANKQELETQHLQSLNAQYTGLIVPAITNFSI